MHVDNEHTDLVKGRVIKSEPMMEAVQSICYCPGWPAAISMNNE